MHERVATTACTATAPVRVAQLSADGRLSAGELDRGGGRIDALTSMRLLPALMVVVSHIGPPPNAGAVTSALFKSMNSAVTIFFVLSGFVLAHNYYDRFATGYTPRMLLSYLVARLARIYPLYLVMLVWVSFASLARGELQGTLWLEHALALQAWRPALNAAFAFNTPGWSVSVEVFLYSAFPVLVIALERLLRVRRGAVFALGLIIVSMVGLTSFFVASGYAELPLNDPRSAYRWLYRTPLCRLGDFCLGILAARFVSIHRESLQRHAQTIIATSACVTLALMCWPAHASSAPSWDLSYALPATCLIAGLASAPPSRLSRALSARWLLTLGEASYALYLCHAYLLSRITPAGVPASAWYLEKAVTVGAILATAVGLHVAFERPARVLLRRLLAPTPLPLPNSRNGSGSPGVTGALALASAVPVLLLGFAFFRQDPDFETLLARATTLINTGRSFESLVLLDQAEQVEPDAFSVHNNRCVAFGNLHQKQPAVDACRRALRLAPTSQLARNNLAWVEGL